jgi:hypothetical protein
MAFSVVQARATTTTHHNYEPLIDTSHGVWSDANYTLTSGDRLYGVFSWSYYPFSPWMYNGGLIFFICNSSELQEIKQNATLAILSSDKYADHWLTSDDSGSFDFTIPYTNTWYIVLYGNIGEVQANLDVYVETSSPTSQPPTLTPLGTLAIVAIPIIFLVSVSILLVRGQHSQVRPRRPSQRQNYRHKDFLSSKDKLKSARMNLRFSQWPDAVQNACSSFEKWLREVLSIDDTRDVKAQNLVEQWKIHNLPHSNEVTKMAEVLSLSTNVRHPPNFNPTPRQAIQLVRRMENLMRLPITVSENKKRIVKTSLHIE